VLRLSKRRPTTGTPPFSPTTTAKPTIAHAVVQLRAEYVVALRVEYVVAGEVQRAAA
jgi:hypothetical protein